MKERNKRDFEECDLIVVGAGPAGLFCAINSCETDKRVLLLEKKQSPGRKLLVSGSGRCNLTHDGDARSFLDHYGDHGRFLRPALLSFTNSDLISFFETRGLPMIRKEGGKIFPETLRSKDVLAILVEECRARGVDLKFGREVKSMSRSLSGSQPKSESRSHPGSRSGNEDEFVVVSEDHAYRSPHLVIATGGRSYPGTGSAGDGYRFAQSLGHKITEIGPALTPIIIKNYPFSDLAGISFSDAEVSLHRKKKVRDMRGDVLFTHQGLSGPGILDLSRHIRAGDFLKLSFIPSRKRTELEGWLQDRTQENGARKLKSVLLDLNLPARLMTRILELSKIPTDLRCAHMTKKMRTLLVDNLTGFPMIVESLGSFDIAMVTRGGVDLKGINPKTMESKLAKGLYFVGEVLDVDGDCGGYNLQAAFSTGWLAAEDIRESWSDL